MEIIKKILFFVSIFFIILNLILVLSSLNNQNNLFITGRAGTTQTGTTSVNITGVVSITLTTSTVDFGSGYVNSSSSNCTMNSENFSQSFGCVGFTDPGSGFILENDGNVNVSITLNTTTANNFIGGTNPLYQFKSSDSETGSCISGLVSSYTDTIASPQTICSNFGFVGISDELEIDLNIRIPDDANVGYRSTNVTFTATQI